MKGTWKEHERKMKENAIWEEYACKWKENEGKCMQINAKLKEHEVLPKHLKPTKQLLDPFPSLFRNGFWLHVHKTLESDRPLPKSDNHNNSNSDVKDFDGNSYVLLLWYVEICLWPGFAVMFWYGFSVIMIVVKIVVLMWVRSQNSNFSFLRFCCLFLDVLKTYQNRIRINIGSKSCQNRTRIVTGETSTKDLYLCWSTPRALWV